MARILAVKGLRGAVKVEPLTDWPDHLAAGASVYLEDESEPRVIRRAERGGRSTALSLAGIETREAAEPLVGRYLEVEAGELPAGTYYWHQLVGLVAYDVVGRPLGDVVEIFRAGENEVYRISDGNRETLVPALRSVVRDIDIVAGRMVVDLETEEIR